MQIIKTKTGIVYRETLNFNIAELHGETARLNKSGIRIGGIEDMRRVTKEEFAELGFGFFADGNSKTNDYNPDATLENILPKPEDLMKVPYRLLSATIVGGQSWKASDFRDEDVLKPAAPLINKKPVFVDHSMDSDNWVGLVASPYWQSEFTKTDGQKVPAGINGDVIIDTKTNTKLARGVAMGALYASSVSVIFDWKPSHDFEDIQEFYNQMGEFHKDGQMICRKATRILDFRENSLVPLGADPFAGKLDPTGAPDQIDKTSVFFSRSISFNKVEGKEKETYTDEKKFTVDEPLFDENIIALSAQAVSKPTGKNSPTMKLSKKFLIAFLAAFGTSLNLSFTGIDGEDLTEAQEAELSTALAKLSLKQEPNADDAKLLAFAKSLQMVQEKDGKDDFVPIVPGSIAAGQFIVVGKPVYEAAQTAKVDLTKRATIGDSFIQSKRDEAIRLYKLSTPSAQQDQTVVNLITNAAPEALDGLLKQYGASTTVKFKPTCTKCNSDEHINMRSSFPTGNPGITEPETASYEEVDMDDYAKTERMGRGIFGIGK